MTKKLEITKKQLRDQQLQQRPGIEGDRDRKLEATSIEPIVRSLLQERQLTLSSSAQTLGVTRPTLYAWLKSHLWYCDPKVTLFNQTYGVDLFQLALTNFVKPIPEEKSQRRSSNISERAKYPVNSFGYVLYDYLLQKNMSIAELEDQIGCYRNQLHYIIKRKIKIKENVYNKLCVLSDTFIRFFPWILSQPKLEEHDIKMRDLIMFHHEEQLSLEQEFKKQKTKFQQDTFLSSKMKR